MNVIIWLVLLIFFILALFYWRVSLAAGSAAAGAAIAAWTWLICDPVWAAVVLWLVFIPSAIVLNYVPLRKQLISEKLYNIFKKLLPDISRTEREALEAGSVWWEGELFSGAPDWDKLHAIPDPKLTAEEQAFLDGPVEELCGMLDDYRITRKLHDLTPEAWSFIKANGFFGMIIPKKYGGLGFSALAHSAVVMKIGSRNMAAAVTVMVPNSLGPAELLLSYGTQEQKDKYLPRLASGEEVPCFALTSSDAGSDAASMPDFGIVCKREFEGEEKLGIRLTFDKRYITLAPVSTLAGLAFKLFDPDHLIGDMEDLGITVALVPTDTPGVETGRRHDPMGVAFMNGPVRGKDVFIPMEWIVGGQERVGQGWMMLMERLAIGRSISLPAISVAAGKYASGLTGAYARIRKQFKLSIGRFEGVSEKLAYIAGQTYLMNAARIMTVGAVDQGERPAVASAIMKYNMTERMRRIINDAMDIHAGSGISLGPRNLMGRAYTALPISITVEGANILTRSLIVFGQGAIRCHPYVLKQMESVKETDYEKGLNDYDAAFFGHAGFTTSNAVRAFFTALTGSRLVTAPPGKAKRYYQKLSRMSAAFAFAADMAMLTLGGDLKKKESLSGRFADALSGLYLGSAALKRFESDGSPDADLPLVQWSLESSLYDIQDALDGIIDNLPLRPAAWLLRAVVFPLGKCYKRPSDRLGAKAASVIFEPGGARDRLTGGVFKSGDVNDPAGRMEDAFVKVVKAEQAEKKLNAAVKAGTVKSIHEDERIEEAAQVGAISGEEAEWIREAAAARREVVAVDDFAQEHFEKDK